MDIEAVAADWRKSGFSCDVWQDPPHQRWENFTHAVDEMLMPLSGHIELEVAGELFHPAIGETVFIPAGARHSVRTLGDSGSQWLYGYRTNG